MRLIRVYDSYMRVIDLDEVACVVVEHNSRQEYSAVGWVDNFDYWLCFILKSGKKIIFGKGEYESAAQCFCSYARLVEVMFDTNKTEWDPWGEEK
jgi:hypothetical protein